MHVLEALFECMLRTSYIFVNHGKLFCSFVAFHQCELCKLHSLQMWCYTWGVQCPCITCPIAPMCPQHLPFLLCTQKHTRANRNQNCTFERIMVETDGPKPASKGFNIIYFMWQWIKL